MNAKNRGQALDQTRCVLDKLRAEVISINRQADGHTMFIRTGEQVKRVVVDIIDKYKAEVEVEE